MLYDYIHYVYYFEYDYRYIYIRLFHIYSKAVSFSLIYMPKSSLIVPYLIGLFWLIRNCQCLHIDLNVHNKV